MKVWTVSTNDDSGTNTQLFTNLAQAERFCAEWVRGAWFLDYEPMPQDWRAAYQMLADAPGMYDTLCLSEHDIDDVANGGSDGKTLMFSDEEEDETQPFTFRFEVAMDVRAYGSVDIEAPTFEEARKQLTAEIVAKRFTPLGGGDDDFDWTTPRDIASSAWVQLDANYDEVAEGEEAINVPPGPWERKPEPDLRFCVDGVMPDDTLGADDEAVAPFRIFDIERQDYLSGTFRFRSTAEMAADGLNRARMEDKQ